MRKRIAVFVNGWSDEFVRETGEGIRNIAKERDMDIFTFLNYTSRADSEESQIAEYNIFTLPNLKDFDGAIIMANTFNLEKELEYVRNSVIDAGIPAIALEYKYEDIPYLGSDDYSGMYEVVEHMIKVHAAKEIVFIAGIRNHTGSEARIKAAKDAATANGITIPDANILYGNFAAAPASEALDSWMLRNKRIPDAIICANDMMAVGICEHLKKKGLFVPFDVKVTGFDCIKEAREYEPVITSVGRNWKKMGSLAMEKLLAMMEGQEIEMNEEMEAHMTPGESCGCEHPAESLSSKILNRLEPKRKMDSFAYDQHFRHMYLAMRKNETLDQLNAGISQFFKEEGWVEGSSVLLALRPNFFIAEGFDGMDAEGYPKKMDVFCHVHEGILEPIRRMNTMDAVIEIAKTSDEPGNYVFVPIRVDEFTLGFAALTMDLPLSNDTILYRWCRHMSQYIEQVKSNVLIRQLTNRLENLSITDGLTGVYNRAGCESIIYSNFIKNQQTGGRSIVMLADVDNLKHINDTFGHRGGDQAICYAVRILKNTLPDDFMIGRYGGDEFLIVGCVREEMELGFITAAIDQNMKKYATDVEFDFEPAISVGAIQLAEGDMPDFNECICRADDNMYQIKARHKAEKPVQD